MGVEVITHNVLAFHFFTLFGKTVVFLTVEFEILDLVFKEHRELKVTPVGLDFAAWTRDVLYMRSMIAV